MKMDIEVIHEGFDFCTGNAGFYPSHYRRLLRNSLCLWTFIYELRVPAYKSIELIIKLLKTSRSYLKRDELIEGKESEASDTYLTYWPILIIDCSEWVGFVSILKAPLHFW